jgi:hypothetical protein
MKSERVKKHFLTKRTILSANNKGIMAISSVGADSEVAVIGTSENLKLET